MKTKIPHLILALSLSLFAAQSASAALVFTFSKGGTPGSTLITVSGDTATAGGSGGAAERDDIGFSQAGTGSFRQTGFSTRETSVSTLLRRIIHKYRQRDPQRYDIINLYRHYRGESDVDRRLPI